MRYWDSSALVALCINQPSSPAIREAFADDPRVTTWVLSDVEFRSALARLTREGAIQVSDSNTIAVRFDALWSEFSAVSELEAVKARAKRLLGLHALSAGDAMQLGAALSAVYDNPTGWDFVTLDQRLADAARREGFTVLP